MLSTTTPFSCCEPNLVEIKPLDCPGDYGIGQKLIFGEFTVAVQANLNHVVFYIDIILVWETSIINFL